MSAQQYSLLFFLSILFLNPVYSQADREKYYKLNWAVDAPVTLVAGGLTGLGFHLIGEQEGVDEATLAGLNKADINGLDRFAADYFSLTAEKHSDYLFYGAFPYGIVLLLDPKVRSEAGTIGLMYLETLSLASAGYAMSAGVTGRLRPYAYIQDQPENAELQRHRESLHARNSFYGGHPSIVAASTVFVAKVYNDLHPDSDFKYVLWGIAGGASLGCAYLRLKAGRHFPSDLITGLAISSAIGYFVPHFHRNNKNKAGHSLRIMPFTGEVSGLSIRYRFN